MCVPLQCRRSHVINSAVLQRRRAAEVQNEFVKS